MESGQKSMLFSKNNHYFCRVSKEESLSTKYDEKKLLDTNNDHRSFYDECADTHGEKP